jgi:phosphatidylinositol alpha-1,6-mannosyltransferase
VRARVPEAVLLLVGEGPERPRLEGLAAALGVAEHVRFAGAVHPAEVPAYLRLGDVFVRPSLNEGLGSAFLEAMAAGLPIVGSRAGGIPDFLEEGRTGLFCDPDRPDTIAQALIRILTEPALAARLTEAGRDLVSRGYRWDTVAERLGALYDRVLSTPTTR